MYSFKIENYQEENLEDFFGAGGRGGHGGAQGEERRPRHHICTSKRSSAASGRCRSWRRLSASGAADRYQPQLSAQRFSNLAAGRPLESQRQGVARNVVVTADMDAAIRGAALFAPFSTLNNIRQQLLLNYPDTPISDRR